MYFAIGFSFGGILAHICATHLWSLSQGICSELLEKNLLCITFGQPVIAFPQASSFVGSTVDKSRFHAVYFSDDVIPRMMRFLDPFYTDHVNDDLPERFRSENTQNEVKKHFLSNLTCSMMRMPPTL